MLNTVFAVQHDHLITAALFTHQPVYCYNKTAGKYDEQPIALQERHYPPAVLLPWQHNSTSPTTRGIHTCATRYNKQ